MGLGRERFELASLGDLMELLVDGWRIDRLHYADRSGAAGPPAAYIDLVRGPGERPGRLRARRRPGALAPGPRGALPRGAGDLEAPLARRDPAPRRRPRDGARGLGRRPEPFPEALAFGPATLRAVVPVGQVQSVAGLDIALTSLERHDEGARLRFMCRASDAATRRRMSVLDVIAVDDSARLYRVACAETAPEGNRLEGSFALAPAIPEGVARLTVTIGTVGDEGGSERSVPGPWVFPIPLGAGP